MSHAPQAEFSEEFQKLVDSLRSGPAELPGEVPARLPVSPEAKPPTRRQRCDFLARHVKEGDRVLDLGCGWGEVLYYLKQDRKIRDFGLERRADYVQQCQEIGLEVYQANLNDLANPLMRHVMSREWDVVIALDTLGYWQYPAVILSALSNRVGKIITTVGNAGHFNFRKRALLHGLDLWPNAWDEGDKIRFQSELHACYWSLGGFQRWAAGLGYDCRLLARRASGANYKPARPFASLLDRMFLFELTPRK